MLKITEIAENGTAVRLKLDGTINADSYKDLDEAFTRHQDTTAKTIILDMAGVDFMSEEAARKVTKLHGERLSIINCSPFILTLLQTVEKQDA